MATKPNDDELDSEDERFIKKLEEGLEEFAFSADEDYRVPKHLRDTTLKKYKTILLTREKQYKLVKKFNDAVYRLRNKKKKLYELMVQKTEVLKSIHEEIEPDEILEIPEIFEFGDEDYPEKQFEVKPRPERKKRKKQHKIIEPPNDDLLQLEILEIKEHVEEIEDETLSEWEIEMIEIRHSKKVFEQHQIIRELNVAIEKFDKKVVALSQKRVKVNVQNILYALHLLTLNQEYMILKEYESKEQALSDKVHEKMCEVMEQQDIITLLNKDIDICKKENERLQEKEKEIHRTFTNAAQDSKFFDFLRKIFKKKYKPPREHLGDDSESDSSSSSSDDSEDEEDAGSIDSRDFNIVKLEENVCPKGCDQGLYDLTFSLRSQRHEVEQKIREQNNKIESIKKECEGYNKQIKILERALHICQDDLEEFLKEKQSKLNEVLCTIILNADQMQHFDENGDLVPPEEMVIVSTDYLTELNLRVEKIDQEIAVIEAQNEISSNHLKRLQNDIDFMDKEIEKWNKKTRNLMMEKCGREVEIDELEEFSLKKLIYDLKIKLSRFQKMWDEEVKRQEKQLAEKNQHLAFLYKRNTEKAELFRLLQKQRNDLINFNATQGEYKDKVDKMLVAAENLKTSIKSLKGIVQEQNKEIEELTHEIKILKTKGYSIKERKIDEIDDKIESVEDEEELSPYECWEELDDYMYTENYAREYWAQKQNRELMKTRKEIVLSIIEELFANIKAKIKNSAITNILKKVISNELNKHDVQEIINDILDAVPKKLNDEQQSLLELTTEKLNSLEELSVMTEEDFRELNIIFEKILDEVLIEESNEVYLQKLIGFLVDKLPLSFLLKNQNIHRISLKIKENIPVTNIEIINDLKEKVDIETFEGRAVFSEVIGYIMHESKDSEEEVEEEEYEETDFIIDEKFIDHEEEGDDIDQPD